MTTTVTKESLAARIADLESGARSLKEDYTLAAYKMLLATMEAEPVAWTNSDALADVYCGETSMMGPEDTIGYTPLYIHAQPALVVPDGYVMVPKEPTEAMLTASYMFAHVESTRESWAAMLAAAPQEVN